MVRKKVARNKLKHIKYNNHKIKQMKNNNYIEPTIDLCEMEVEQGIAMSIESSGFEDVYLEEKTIEW